MSLVLNEADVTADQVLRLLDACGAGDDELRRAVDEVGADAACDVLVWEIAERALLNDFVAIAEHHNVVTIVLTHEGREHVRTLKVRPGRLRVRRGHAPELAGLAPVLTQDLCEVARSLYGPASSVSSWTRRIAWPSDQVLFSNEDQLMGWVNESVGFVSRIVRVLDRGELVDFLELAARFQTDKWGPYHQYARAYDTHLRGLRQTATRILEIGVGGYDDPAAGGESLRVWKRFFPRALVVGLDIVDKHLVDEPRIVTVRADQSDPASLLEVAERYGPFDVVIDDGSHLSAHVITSFETLFTHVRPGGLYIVEDLQTAYMGPKQGGVLRDFHDPACSIGFLKDLVDGLNHREILDAEARRPRPTDAEIGAIHFYHNVAVLERTGNREASPFAELLRRTHEPAE